MDEIFWNKRGLAIVYIAYPRIKFTVEIYIEVVMVKTAKKQYVSCPVRFA